MIENRKLIECKNLRTRIMKIKYTISGLEISGYGISKKGLEVDVPEEVGKSLIEQGLAKETKNVKITKEVIKEEVNE